MLELDGMQQSIVDLEAPTRLAFDYMRRIGDLIDTMPAGRLRILHVGGAAMTLPRYVAATRPGSRQVVLEPSVEVIEQVRAEAPLPPRSGIKVRPVDGQAGILEVRDDSQDLVILDAFAGGAVPADLMAASFVEQVQRVLAPEGVFVANLVDRAPFPAIRDFVARVREIGPVAVGVEPATLKGRRPGNLVVAAGGLAEQPFANPSPMEYRVHTGRAVSDSFGGGSAG
ncbi:fused MFS/spermidine synthase [Aeromicrobium sp.]|uniref:spermidine synthase n=1 Tax=Aeromicrobium sp. TaxID=1871063 RepID=UPI0028A8CBEE|nr:fused MFS/spermidine synthase [Aeromicrobium sp.]